MSVGECLTRRGPVGSRTAAALAVLAGLLVFSSAPAAHANLVRPAAAVKPPPYGTLWITAEAVNSVLEFAPGANSNPTPVADISGPATLLNNPRGVAIDHQGRVWVASLATNAVEVFGAHADGNVAPVLTIAGAKTELNAPFGIALEQNGDLWVANSGSNTLAEFAAGAHGNVTPIRLIAGSNTSLSDLTGIAVSPDGTRVWASEQHKRTASVPPALVEFAGTAHGNVKPRTEISGLTTRLNDPSGVAVGIKGNDPITDNENLDNPSAVLRFASGAHGNVAPARTISGENTGLRQPQLLALDAVGNVWVANTLNDLVLRFGPTQHGNVGPQRLFEATGLDTPGSIAVFIAPPGAPSALKAHATKKKLRLTWSAPHVTGGGILGYQVRRAHKKSGPWTVVKTTAKLSYTKSHPHGGFFYDVVGFNDAGYSRASHPTSPKV